MAVTTKDVIRQSAIYFRNKPAMVCGERNLTFGEVDERANRLANALAGLGLKPGNRVATLMHNSLEFVEICFAMVKGGFPQVSLNPRLPPADLTFQLNETEASAIVVQHEDARAIDSIRGQIGNVKQFISFDGSYANMLDYDSLIAAASPKEPDVQINMDDLGEIQYSGGTTGKPKGIMLPFANKLAVARNNLLDKTPDLGPSDRFMAVQPLYHGAGWYVLPAWIRGATQYLIPTATADVALDAIEQYKITVIKTIPTVLLRLLDSPDIKKRDLRSVRTLVYGAEAMRTERLKEAMGMFGPIFVQAYGQMEAAAAICSLRKEDHIIAWRNPDKEYIFKSVGRPLTFVNVKIVDEQSKEVPRGEFGEVAVSGDHIMIGYLNRPEEMAKKKRNGWIFTGDMGRMDEDGYVFLTGGRKSEMIKSGGLQVYPAEVEQVLAQHPAVAQVAVIGVPDRQWGEAVKACVVLKPGKQATEPELIEFCRDKIAGYKKPKSVDFFQVLPTSGTDKVAYAELKKLYLSQAQSRWQEIITNENTP